MTQDNTTSGLSGLGQARQFRDYKVVAKQVESEVISSFVLETLDGSAVPAYQPGHYLVFKFIIAGQTVLRNYSVSGDPADPTQLRISVKHELAPPGLSVPDGIGSGFWHRQIQVGDRVQAAGPLGDFYLDESSQRPVVLLSGGVGITPMLAMLHRLVKGSSRPVHFMHACDNGAVHAFGAEVTALAAQRAGVQTVFWYRQPLAQDRQQPWSFIEGMVAKADLQRHLPLDDYEFYLCGPSGFMQSNYALLRELGVTADRIHYEFFGPATVLESTLQTTPAVLNPVQNRETTAGVVPAMNNSQTLTFLPDGRQAQWQENCESLLVAAEDAGLQPAFNCRAGICNSCMCTLVSGEVEYFDEPLDRVPEGKVLLCCARPKTAVVIDIES